MNAISIGFKTIYIFGADHSWLKDIEVDNDNNVLVNQKHFYDNDTSKPRPMHKKGIHNRKLHEVLMKFMLAFAGYHEINDYSRRKGINIYNATTGSYIDAFKRISLKNTEK
jgi:hypothetical protein